jgi:hypothetical protein
VIGTSAIKGRLSGHSQFEQSNICADMAGFVDIPLFLGRMMAVMLESP